jgi:hypothetical protein
MAQFISLTQEDFTLEIPRKPQLSYPSAERLNFISNETAYGNRFIIDLGPTRVVNSLSFLGLEKSIVDRYEDFIMYKARWGLNPFTIICPEYFDLGYGTGITVNNAYYFGKNNLASVIKPMEGSGKFFNIELPYMFLREE